MERAVQLLDRYFSGPVVKLAEQRHLQAVRNGVISALPFIIIGSFFLIIAFPPVPENSAIARWAEEHVREILIPYRLTMFIMSLYIVYGIGYNLAKSYRIDPLAGAQISVAAFLLTITPHTIDEVGEVLPMTNLGGRGLFVAILTSLVAVEILRFCKKKNWTIKMPDQVPPALIRSFEALIPVAITVVLMTLITVVFRIDLHAVIGKLVSPLVTVGDSLLGVLVPVFLITFFWSLGIHGDSIVGTIARPLWEVFLANNAEAVVAGKTIPHAAPETFFQWFVWIGGSGATFGLVLCMLFFARTKYSKTLGKTALAPSIFNINEPVIFGVPIMLNPIMIIPFVITPLITSTLSYFATVLGLVTPTYIMPPWTLPAPIGAYLATGGDWRAVALVVVNVAISFVIYYPFFRMHERKLIEEEETEQRSGA